MSKDSNSNKRKLKLRKIEKERLAKRKKRAREVLVKAGVKTDAEVKPKRNYNKKRVMTTSALAMLFFLFLIYPSEPIKYVKVLCGDISFNKISADVFHKKTSNPYALYSVPKKNKAKDELHKHVMKIIKNTPMEVMADDIVKRDRDVAAFIVGIAMKESKFGKFSPKKNGVECYNYWGYRGKENTTASGYSCFDSPEHAIKVVGDTIERIVKQGAQTPAQMISWKCGHSCAGHSPESVAKWISDVGINYYRIKNAVQIAKE